MQFFLGLSYVVRLHGHVESRKVEIDELAGCVVGRVLSLFFAHIFEITIEL